jgi:lysophospholipase L1-like esterase
VIGVQPVNRSFHEGPAYTNTEVQEVNRRLKGLVAEFPGTRFLDATDLMTDPAGVLRAEYTTDGLHHRTDGYLAIRERLEGFEFDGDPSKCPKESTAP